MIDPSRLTRNCARTLPLALLLCLAAPAVLADNPTLQIDQPAPGMGETVQVSGTCVDAGETVNFTFSQKGEQRSFKAQGETTEKSFTTRKGGFSTDLDLNDVQAKRGSGTIAATCSDGRKLATDLNIGVGSSTAGATISSADEANKASNKVPAALVIDGATAPEVGKMVAVTGKCPSDDGAVSFALDQNGQTYKFKDVALASGVSFRKELDLKTANAAKGKAKVQATCPGGKLLTVEMDIVE